jgi:hypothetical protein
MIADLVRTFAIVTPSFARDFESCRELNESVLKFVPAPNRHYIIVDRSDLELFRSIKNERTVILSVEEVIPRGFFKVPGSKKWWFSLSAMVPTKGWHVQQLVKLSAVHVADEPVLVNVDSDVRFIRPVDPTLFVRGDQVRMYRLPDGIQPGMVHVKWNRTISRLLGVPADSIPTYDYVGNVISWKSSLVTEACNRIETVTGLPWHVAYTRAWSVAEQLTYGLYVDKVKGIEASGVWVDERSWCHTYWGPGPMPAADVDGFVDALPHDDVAFSIAGYTGTDRNVAVGATERVIERAKRLS